jgi:hypothetical protein
MVSYHPAGFLRAGINAYSKRRYMNADWKVIDIVAVCMENNIRINFQPEKRFYRIRLKDRCGIFDMHSNCFLAATEVIFSNEFERQYKKTENSLEAVEQLMEEFGVFCLPSISESGFQTVVQ